MPCKQQMLISALSDKSDCCVFFNFDELKLKLGSMHVKGLKHVHWKSGLELELSMMHIF